MKQYVSTTFAGLVLAAVAAAGCASTSAPSADRSATGTVESATADEASTTQTDRLVVPSPTADSPVATITFNASGHVLANREDGAVAVWTGEDVVEKSALKDGQRVVAWSPSGDVAIVTGEPPVVVRADDKREVLRLVKAKRIETAGFFLDGSGLFVAEPGGQLHVWNESEDTLRDVQPQDLEAFIERQAPAFSAEFAPLAGRATVTSSNQLLLGTESGKLYWWDPSSPESLTTVVGLSDQIFDTAYAGGRVFATTVDGQFRAAERSDRVFLAWSETQKGEWVAASSGKPTRVLVADESRIRMLDARDGREIWSRQLGGALLCGLEMSQDGSRAALCAGGSVVVFATDDASIVATIK